jgi:transposase-like protein
MSPITKASGTKRVVLARYARNRWLGDALFRQAYSALRTSWGVYLPPESDRQWENAPWEERSLWESIGSSAPEYRHEAVKMGDRNSRPIAEVARDLGINEGTLGNWVTKYRTEHPASEDLGIWERARLRELEKENRELRLEREFLKKAVAFIGRSAGTATSRGGGGSSRGCRPS